MQKRRLIKVVKIRLADAKVGDVVNRDGDSEEGWFAVASLDRLFNGSLQVAAITSYITITGGDFDTIALQVVTEVDLPEQTPSEPEFHSHDPDAVADAEEDSDSADELAQAAAH